MWRKAISVGGSLAVIALAGELLLPRYIAGRTARALTAGGGSAYVEVSAFPALRLLRLRGERVFARASGLELTAAGVARTAAGRRLRLDGFMSIDVEIASSRVGPVALTLATLRRDNGGPLSIEIEGSLTAGELSAFAGGSFRGGLGALLGSFAGSTHPLAGRRVPLGLRATLRSDGGRFIVEAVEGTVAGAPGGPIVDALITAVLARL